MKRSIQLRTPLPGPRSQALMLERQQHVARGPFHATPLFAARAHGAVIEDVDGNHLLDFASGLGVVNVGHTPDTVVQAVQAQAGRFLHTGFNVTPYEGYVRLAEALNRAAPGPGPKKTLLVNSGAEAVENAIKIARAATGRPGILCFDHAYHGRTYMAMSVTAKAKPYKFGFAPFPSDVYRAPYPYMYRWPTGSEAHIVSEECFARFEEIVHTQVGASTLAAVIIEPVLGEGGFVPCPPEFLAKLRNFCTQHGIVLIADEVQTGFGRTGALFASHVLGFEPDLITTAKGLGAGLPIAGVTGRADLMDAPGEGGIGGTFGGNPVACAAALEVFNLFSDGSLAVRAQQIGEILRLKLEDWKTRYPQIGDVRGLGPMRGIEFVKDRITKEPDKDAASRFIQHAWRNGVVLLSAGTFGNVARFLVPLVITDDQLQEGLEVLEAGLR